MTTISTAVINGNTAQVKPVPTDGMSYKEMDVILKGDWLKARADNKGLLDPKTKRFIMREKIARCLLENKNKPMTAKEIGQSLFSNRRSIHLVSSYTQDLHHAGILDSIGSYPAVYFFAEHIVETAINVEPISIDDLSTILKKSPFKRRAYQATLPLQDFIECLMLYIDSYRQQEIGRVFNAVPDFQRDNDKWSPIMQTKFIENLILGYKTTIMLYEIVPANTIAVFDKCKILDGLQRITALYGFMKGTVTAFGKTYSELCEGRIINRGRQYLDVRIYEFSCEVDAIDFYISMNENITHAPADIQKAKTILKNAKSISATITEGA